MKGTDLRERMLKEFDCIQVARSDLKTNSRREKRRQTAEKSFLIFMLIRNQARSKEEAIRLVRDKWSVGMSPVVAWFAWLLVRTLVEAIVTWLWNNRVEETA